MDALTFVLVGKDGAYYHSKEATDDGNGYLQSCAWFQQTGVFDGNTDPYLVDASSDIDIHTISFGTSTLGVLGGKYKSSFADFGNEQHCYVRTVYDAPERYSARFYYDKLGRLVVSQNARQYNADQVGENAYKKYSYSLYDALGRVIEAGEKSENPIPSPSTGSGGGNLNRFRDVFGSYVSDIYNPSVIDDAKLQAWIEGAGERREVTRSYYDQTVIAALPSGFSPNPTTQRKRITHVTYEETFDGNDQTYDHATHYDYDIHGNVKTMLQDNKKMAEQFSSLESQQFKRLDYRYDLVSGNVHRMSVQNGEVDQWHHAYRYDADNRIVEAYTNKHTPLIGLEQASYNLENELNVNNDWENDAKYYYYAHGLLSRIELGNNQLQGIDFIYNTQTWIKGINSIENVNDPGKDGYFGVNKNFAKDLTAFSLGFYTNDYTAINSETPIPSVNNSSNAATNSSDLYNGNIRYVQTRLTNPSTYENMPMLNAYQYDQLNRLKESRSYESGLSGNVWNPMTYGNEYYNAFDFDAMGNILSQVRHNRAGTKIEDMQYKYHYLDPTTNTNLQSNRLYHIYEPLSLSSLDPTDIDNMGAYDSTAVNINVTNNYSYDEDGRLIKDKSEKIDKIVWRADGKVKEIQRSNTEEKWLKFDYDAMGHRIGKHVYSNGGVNHERSTYYILDAEGNQISTYDHEVVSETAQFNLKERNIYGSMRLGSKQDSLNVLNTTLSQNISQILGAKYFEFSNHLGNVLTVFSDIKIPLDNDADGDVDEYKVQIVNSVDYSPFGVELDGRTIQKDFFRFGFQSQEKDDEVKGGGNSVNYKYRMHDPRVGRFFTVDPLISSYPHYSSYSFSGNRVINSVELEGKEDKDCFYWSDPSLASFRNQNSYQVNKQCEKAFKEGMVQGAALGGAIVIDVVVTKGALSSALFYAALGQGMNATDRYHEAKAEGNDVKAKECKKEMEETGSFITSGIFGFALSKSFTLIKYLPEVPIFAKAKIVFSGEQDLEKFQNVLSKMDNETASSRLLDDGWQVVQEKSIWKNTVYKKTIDGNSYYLRWNETGKLHSTTDEVVKYWKLGKGKNADKAFLSKNILMRASKNKNFKN